MRATPRWQCHAEVRALATLWAQRYPHLLWAFVPISRVAGRPLRRQVALLRRRGVAPPEWRAGTPRFRIPREGAPGCVPACRRPPEFRECRPTQLPAGHPPDSGSQAVVPLRRKSTCGCESLRHRLRRSLPTASHVRLCSRQCGWPSPCRNLSRPCWTALPPHSDRSFPHCSQFGRTCTRSAST